MGSCHTVLCKGASLVTQQVLYTSEFFGKSARPHDSVRNFWIMFNLVPIHCLAHVEVHSETECSLQGVCEEWKKNSIPDRDNGREEDEEPEDVDIPQPPKAVKRNEDERKGECHSTQYLHRH